MVHFKNSNQQILHSVPFMVWTFSTCTVLFSPHLYFETNWLTLTHQSSNTCIIPIISWSRAQPLWRVSFCFKERRSPANYILAGLKSKIGHRLAQWVEQASHVERLCPCCSRFKSRPGALCFVSLPLSLNLFPVISSNCPKANKNKWIEI